MKILILGSEGFIGANLVRYFLSINWQVIGCDQIEMLQRGYTYHKVSLLSADIETLFEGQQFDVCINAAGSGNVSYSITHPLSDFEANVLAVIHFLETLRRHDPACRYIHISSAAVYGNPERLPVSENLMCKPISPYGYHKLMSEQICAEYNAIYKLPVAIVRPFSVYGYGQRKQLLWDLCQKLQNADDITLFGTGAESRDFIHIYDLAKLIHHIIQSGNFSADVFNAASGKETTIRQVADIFEAYYKTRKINFSGEVRRGDPLKWCSDISKAASLGFSPSIDLRQGIHEFIDWYKAL